MQNPRLRTVYRQRKWPLPAPVRKIMALGCQVFNYSVKCSEHGLRSFIDAVQRCLATQTVTMLTPCWQVLSEVELRRIFYVCERWANSSFACICKEKYGSIHEAARAIRLLFVWKSSTYPQPRPGGFGRGFVRHFHICSARTARFGLLYRNILFWIVGLFSRIASHIVWEVLLYSVYRKIPYAYSNITDTSVEKFPRVLLGNQITTLSMVKIAIKFSPCMLMVIFDFVSSNTTVSSILYILNTRREFYSTIT